MTEDCTLPGARPPAEPVPLDERSTRPVPLAKAQVFYFDDLGTSAPQPRPSPARLSDHPVGPPAGAPSYPPNDDQLSCEELSHSELSPSNQAAPAPTAVDDRPLAKATRARRKPVTVAAAVLAAAAVVVALVAVGLSLTGGPPGPGPSRQAASAGAPKTRAKHNSSPAGPGGQSTQTTLPTTSTAPPQPAALVSSSAGVATYHLSSTSDSITVDAKGPCWIEVKANSPSGQIVYEGTLVAGQHPSVTGPAWIRLGDPPQVDVLVNGKAVNPPGLEVAAPLNLQFTVG